MWRERAREDTSILSVVMENLREIRTGGEESKWVEVLVLDSHSFWFCW